MRYGSKKVTIKPIQRLKFIIKTNSHNVCIIFESNSVALISLFGIALQLCKPKNVSQLIHFFFFFFSPSSDPKCDLMCLERRQRYSILILLTVEREENKCLLLWVNVPLYKKKYCNLKIWLNLKHHFKCNFSIPNYRCYFFDTEQ